MPRGATRVQVAPLLDRFPQIVVVESAGHQDINPPVTDHPFHVRGDLPRCPLGHAEHGRDADGSGERCRTSADLVSGDNCNAGRSDSAAAMSEMVLNVKFLPPPKT